MASSIMASSSAFTAHFLHRKLQFPYPRPPAFRPIRAQLGGEERPFLHIRRLLPTILKPAAALATALFLAPLPAMAEEMEKAALFDFNLTLPAIALEFLLLMFALDKIYFTPLGKFMDDRDAWIRAQLEEVKDTSEEVKQLEEKAAAIMKAARAEVAAALNQMQKETSAELEKMILEEKNKVEKELIEALAALEKQKEEALQALDSQITLLAEEIVNKVLPPA
ncbi:hypothetical protein HPP92_016414 [Vanilla planifolia]|uniref:ATP synthase subunit b', chloroplastic n=1 Tax=Vanilla planifolia TaxID=51239 RepID=A0A835QK50_VANPL|nr:hypothetical protein HPP92_017087 [Vanilla planifolia]KAG0471868.1 hypothetical protein HPP92_016414 [Vanilla planifolia]